MLTFISWSGDQSKFVAVALEKWIAQVIQAVEPWLSSEIEKGARWSPEVSARLEKSKVGIICLTKDNMNEPWILFEAGALSKMQDANVCTLLIGLKHADVKQPLAQFQHTSTEKEDMWRLVETINSKVHACGEKGLQEGTLRDVFETFWPKLEMSFNESTAITSTATTDGRSNREVLEEILELVRNQQRDQLNSPFFVDPRTLEPMAMYGGGMAPGGRTVGMAITKGVPVTKGMPVATSRRVYAHDGIVGKYPADIVSSAESEEDETPK